MTIDEIVTATHGVLLNKKKERKIKKFQIDTRKLGEDDVFIALKTAKGNGHQFIKDAIKKKASLIIVCEAVSIKTKVPILKVQDTYECLFDLACYMRKKYPIFCIAVTGSSGKTTVKELLYEILSLKYQVLKSEKNENNHIGVPLTCLNTKEHHQILLTEIGMNHEKEISKLSKLLKPTIGVITNIGSSHIGNLGSIKKIKKAKLEILDGMEEGLLFVNGKDSNLKNIQDKRVIKTGVESLKPLMIKGNLEKTEFTVFYQKKVQKIIFHGPKYFISNILLALDIGLFFDIPFQQIKEVIQNFSFVDQRMELKKKKYLLIDDTYNASYESVSSALELLKEEKRKKIIVLGDMLELGKYSKEYHKKINKILKKIKNKNVLLVGKETKIIKGKHFSSNQELINYLKNLEISDEIIYVKGSRKIHLEEVTNFIESYFT